LQSPPRAAGGAKEIFAMHMLYNSDSFTVVAVDIPRPAAAAGGDDAARGGFEIVDKHAQTDIFIEGAMAASFQAGVEALMESKPSEEDIDEFIARFASLMPQPLVLH
jgi:hypothetical protein